VKGTNASFAGMNAQRKEATIIAFKAIVSDVEREQLDPKHSVSTDQVGTAAHIEHQGPRTVSCVHEDAPSVEGCGTLVAA